MKLVFKSILLIVAAALMSIGCNKEIASEEPNEQGFTYYFRITNNDTKTTIGSNSIAWEANDQLGVFAEGTINKFAKITTITPSVEFPLYLSQALETGDVINCYYPYSEVLNKNATADAVKMSIPTVQKVEATGAYDADAMPMVSLPYETSEDMATGNTTVDDLYFMMLGGIFQFNIYGADFTSETIQAVEFQADQAIVGDFTFDLTAVDAEDASSLEINGYEKTTVGTTLNAAVGANKESAVTAYMVVAPGSYTGKVVVKTNAADYTFNITSAKVIERGHVKPLNVNLANAERTLPKPAIADGLYLITNTDKNKAASCFTTGNNLKAKSISIDASGNVSSEDVDVDVYDLAMTFTLVTSGEFAGMYTITDNNGLYLYHAGAKNGTKNYLQAKDNPDETSYWTITETDGTYLIQATKTTGNTRNIIRYNSSSSLFSCYETGQNDIKLVPFATDDTPKPVISEIEDPEEVSKEGDVVSVSYTITNPVEGQTISAEASAGWVNTFDYSVAGEISFLVDANTGVARTCTVTVSYEGAKNVTFEVSQAAGNGGQGGNTYTKISSLSALTTGDYVIVGQKNATSFGLLTYGELASKGRLPFVADNTSLPGSFTDPDGGSVWSVTVTVTESETVKSVTLFNNEKETYLAAGSSDGYLAFSETDGISYSVTCTNGIFSFQTGSNYLCVNNAADYWRNYAASTGYNKGVCIYLFKKN